MRGSEDVQFIHDTFLTVSTVGVVSRRYVSLCREVSSDCLAMYNKYSSECIAFCARTSNRDNYIQRDAQFLLSLLYHTTS